ncbi:MAG: hypothetical protein C4582_02060 [Desulfobacteraceae bacterium]|nr:MAG: hypothetical protein C4582_02060 [Desulfobacteraceae bacterium]
MWWSKSFFGVIVLCFFFIGGCAYSLREKGQPIGITIPSLSIPMMGSTSSALGFEADFTSVIRQEFVSHARVPLVSPEDAAFLLTGEVYDITTEPLSYKSTKSIFQGETLYYEVTSARTLRLKLRAKLVDRKTGEPVWEEKAMEGKASYSVSSDPMTTRFNQTRAVRTIAKDLAEKMYLKTMERF